MDETSSYGFRNFESTDTHSHAHFFSVLALRRTCDALRTLQYF